VTTRKRKGSDLNENHISKHQKQKISDDPQSSSHDVSEKLDNHQLLLLKKGTKLREILLNESLDDLMYISNESLISEISIELATNPMKITDEKSAVERIKQWDALEKKCIKFTMAAELYNLLHLMSLVDIYEGLIEIGKKMKKQNIKKWVIQFMVANLKISHKMEQRNRLGCDRLRNLYKEGITSEQLVQAGIKKCDFFVKQENYDIFLSQIPSVEMRHSLTNGSDRANRSDRLSEVPSSFFTNTENEVKNDGEKIFFKLKLGEEFKEIVDEDEYIEFY
jgi:hypothetical protein